MGMAVVSSWQFPDCLPTFIQITESTKASGTDSKDSSISVLLPNAIVFVGSEILLFVHPEVKGLQRLTHIDQSRKWQIYAQESQNTVLRENCQLDQTRRLPDW